MPQSPQRDYQSTVLTQAQAAWRTAQTPLKDGTHAAKPDCSLDVTPCVADSTGVMLPRSTCAAIYMLLGSAVTVGCVDEPTVPVYTECVCESATCGPETCGFELTLHANCDGQLPFAEVLVDDHLEAELLEPGQSMIPCTRFEPGTISTVWIRGGSWIWGPLERGCEPGQVHALVLQCAEE